MNSKQLRKSYLDFFESKSHQRVASDSLVPANDPTLLFTGAGMNQFKDQFMGRNVTYTRATTSQKCIRTGDIESVGRTARHHTFFEMLGNFSFGDYFKREAITWAHEFLTKVVKLDADRLHYSVYKDDDEAYGIWTKEVGIPAERVYRLGEADNYWPASAPSKGPNGPCGPCSEIFYDQGEGYGHGRADSCLENDGDRYIEIWNLVFTQFNRLDGGVLEPLPQENIDTGMGLERIVAVLNGGKTNYDTDLFQPSIQAMAKRTKKTYGENEEDDSRLRRIADHCRSLAFCIADGVMPGNEGRGYVVRRLLRRAALDARNLGVTEACLHELIPIIVDVMGAEYPEVAQRQDKIIKVIHAEEQKFQATLQQGLNSLDALVERYNKAKDKTISGRDAFVLYDTYGFPVELAQELFEEAGLSVDMAGFESEMEKQREQARRGSSMKGDVFAAGPMEKLKAYVGKSSFVGYDKLDTDGKVLAILKGDDLVDKISAGDKAIVIFDQTVFYGESGGQAGDQGTVDGKDLAGTVITSLKTLDVIAPVIELSSGVIAVGDTVSQQVSISRRRDTQRNHTATHLLQWALREVLGTHVEQAGSLVTPDRLRFDFSHFQALTDEEQTQVTTLVNEKIFAGALVNTAIQSIEEAKAGGATALFGEKYGDEVRVVTVGDGFSKELCGGTHVAELAEIGFVKIVQEQSVAAGVRRIEALTGQAAWRASQAEQVALQAAAAALTSAPLKIVSQIKLLQNDNKALQREITQLKEAQALESAKAQAGNLSEINGIPYITQSFDAVSGKELMGLLDGFKQTVKSGVVLLGAKDGKKAGLACYVSKDLVEKGLKAIDIIRQTSPIIQGGGGGREAVAQAGGKKPEHLSEALAALEKILGEHSGN